MEAETSRDKLFEYPRNVHRRRHGPQGYADDAWYKPWLRDEFQFRCVFCLCRERWFPTGDGAFSVDHLLSQSSAVQRVSDYDNLLYACCHCNSAKRNIADVPNPCEEPYGEHLIVSSVGVIRGLTTLGWDLIHICQLDRPKLTEFRQRMNILWNDLAARPSSGIELRRTYFGYPDNLPRLSTLRPPDGNDRPAGIATSYFEQLERNELPDTY